MLRKNDEEQLGLRFILAVATTSYYILKINGAPVDILSIIVLTWLIAIIFIFIFLIVCIITDVFKDWLLAIKHKAKLKRPRKEKMVEELRYCDE